MHLSCILRLLRDGIPPGLNELRILRRFTSLWNHDEKISFYFQTNNISILDNYLTLPSFSQVTRVAFRIEIDVSYTLEAEKRIIDPRYVSRWRDYMKEKLVRLQEKLGDGLEILVTSVDQYVVFDLESTTMLMSNAAVDGTFGTPYHNFMFSFQHDPL